MKILFVDFNYPYLLRDNNYPVGGATVELYSWLTGLNQLGANTSVLTWKGEKSITPETLGSELIEVSYKKGQGLPLIRVLTHIYPGMLQSIKKNRPDVIIQECSGLLTGLTALISRQLNIPFYHRIANDMDVDGRYRQRMRYLEHRMFQYGLKKSDGIICQNTYQLDQLKIAFPEKKMKILHNPFHSLEESGDILTYNDRSYVAWLGVFQYQKNLPALFKIASSLPDIEFRIGGAVGSTLDPESQQALENLKRCSNVRFEGYIKRKGIPDFLSKARCLLNTSHYEGFSNTFLESFSAGTPIVTTAWVDPDHIIEKNNLGYILHQYDDIPEAIRLLMKSQDEYSSLSKRCIEFVAANHSAVQLSKNLLEFLGNDIRK